MKNTMKKIASTLLAVTMIIVLGILAQAESKFKLTIDGPAEGHSYKVYQLLTGDVSGLTNGSGTLANAKAGINLEGTVDDFDAAIKKDGAYLTGTDLAYAASLKITGDPVETLVKDKDSDKATADLVPGYYIVKDTYKPKLSKNYTRSLIFLA